MKNFTFVVVVVAALAGGCKKKDAEPAAGSDTTAKPAMDDKAAAKPTDPAMTPDKPAPTTPAAPAAGGGTSDNSDPAKVVQQIFDAASSGKSDALPGLCAPDGSGDKDAKNVCGAKAGDPKWEEFAKYFAKGKIDGAAKVEGDTAEVNILFGPDGTKKETMKMKKIDGKWYLESF